MWHFLTWCYASEVVLEELETKAVLLTCFSNALSFLFTRCCLRLLLRLLHCNLPIFLLVSSWMSVSSGTCWYLMSALFGKTSFCASCLRVSAVAWCA